MKTEEEVRKDWQGEKTVLSIVCSTYNHEKFIQKALDGFLMQKTNFVFEILVHDDASVDKTPTIVKEYEKRFPHIIKPIYQVINQFSQGKKPFINFQYPRVKGKYIAMCEGDDYWTDPLKLQKQVDFLEKNTDYSFAFHDVNRVDPDDNELARNISVANKFNKNEFSQEEVITLPFFINTVSLVYKNSFSIPNWFSELAMGDKPLLKLLGTKGKGYFFNETMASYREHPGGITKTMETFKDKNRVIKINDNIFIYEKLLTMVAGNSTIESILQKRIEWEKYVIQFYNPNSGFFYRTKKIALHIAFIKRQQKFKSEVIARLIFTRGVSRKIIDKIFK